MQKTVIVLPNGQEVSSGLDTFDAIINCTYTECVNAQTELTIGSVCAAMLEVKLITPGGKLQISAGDELTVYKDDGNARHKLGIFIAEKPERPNANTMNLTAYDKITLLDRDLSEWLANLNDWPYSIYDLTVRVCDVCGLKLANAEIPNGSYLVPRFTAEGITGRQLLQWAAQAAGRFCRATADGDVEFAWYTPAVGQSIGILATPEANTNISYEAEFGTLSVIDANALVTESNGIISLNSPNIVASGSDGVVHLTVSGSTKEHFYFQGSLKYEDYAVDPIEKVQIQANADDVGVIWPNDFANANTYKITGNMLLSDESLEALQPVAKTLYEQLKLVTYTPCNVSIASNMEVRAGHIVSITDMNGNTISAYIMTRRQSGLKDTLECTGSRRRDSVSVVNSQSFAALSKKVMNLRIDVDGIRAENKDADGRLAAVELSLEGISTQVEQQTADAGSIRTALTAVQQTANSLSVSVQSIQDNGVSKVKTGMGYTFNDDGLKIARTGQQMENRLDNTGMYVERSGQTVLRANSDGVKAVDVTVDNYLVVGKSRLEAYEGNRTACFYMGG